MTTVAFGGAPGRTTHRSPRADDRCRHRSRSAERRRHHASSDAPAPPIEPSRARRRPECAGQPFGRLGDSPHAKRLRDASANLKIGQVLDRARSRASTEAKAASMVLARSGRDARNRRQSEATGHVDGLRVRLGSGHVVRWTDQLWEGFLARTPLGPWSREATMAFPSTGMIR